MTAYSPGPEGLTFPSLIQTRRHRVPADEKKKKLKIPRPADMIWRRSPIKWCTATEPVQYACISIQCCLSYFASGRQPCRIERMRWSDVSCSPQPVPRTAQCHQPVCLSDLYYVATGKLSGSSNSVVDVEAARQQLA